VWYETFLAHVIFEHTHIRTHTYAQTVMRDRFNACMRCACVDVHALLYACAHILLRTDMRRNPCTMALPEQGTHENTSAHHVYTKLMYTYLVVAKTRLQHLYDVSTFSTPRFSFLTL
jgi:hypothetical protein